MNLSELIKTLVDYLDLGKRIATTIPGMVLAFGFVLLFAQPPDSMQKRTLQTLVQAQQNEVEISQKQLRDVREESREVTENINSVSQLQGALDTVLQAKVAAYKKSPTAQNLDELRTLSKKKADLGQNLPQFRRKQDELSDLGQNLAKIISSEQAQLDLYRSRAASGNEFDQSLSKAFSSLLLFGLFGFAIGTVLDPVNKALFLQLVPQLGLPSKGTERFATLKKLSGHYLIEPIKTNSVKLSQRTAHYYIGRGLITAADYDGVEADYYRFSEISIGMIVPTMVLAAGIAHVFSARLGLIKFIIYSGSVVIAYFLYLIGLKRYGEFNRHLTDLIAGKERAMKDQEERLAKPSVVVQLTDVVAELRRILHKYQKPAVPNDRDEKS